LPPPVKKQELIPRAKALAQSILMMLDDDTKRLQPLPVR